MYALFMKDHVTIKTTGKQLNCNNILQ